MSIPSRHVLSAALLYANGLGKVAAPPPAPPEDAPAPKDRLNPAADRASRYNALRASHGLAVAGTFKRIGDHDVYFPASNRGETTVNPRTGAWISRPEGSLEAKLKKVLGGNSARRILKRERMATRDNPEQLTAALEDVPSGAFVTLRRGIDFCVVTGYGETFVLLRDKLDIANIVFLHDPSLIGAITEKVRT